MSMSNEAPAPTRLGAVGCNAASTADSPPRRWGEPTGHRSFRRDYETRYSFDAGLRPAGTDVVDICSSPQLSR